MDRDKYEKTRHLLEQTRQLQQKLFHLLPGETLGELIEQLGNTIVRLEHEVEKEVESRINEALSRVNLRDEQYMCMRVIDGDTLEVEPPQELREWMRDVHIRLYGIDTPESNQEFGPVYTKLLENICIQCAGRKLSIIWERERSGTEYSDFPKTSFERGIGNVFIRIDNKVLYVNAFLAMLPHVSVVRNQRDLITGQRKLTAKLPPAAWRLNCTSQIPNPIVESLLAISELEVVYQDHFPACLCILPRDVITVAAQSPVEVWDLVLENITNQRCPYGPIALLAKGAKFEDQLSRRNGSPFDLLLLLASQWQGRNN